jgi:hypothetical protein
MTELRQRTRAEATTHRGPTMFDSLAQVMMEVGGVAYRVGSPGFTTAIARAYDAHQRPRCLCVPGGLEMYVARYSNGYAVKRMPGTGSRHRPECPSFELAADATGMDQLAGTAISEDIDTGRTTLKFGFSLSKRVGPTGRQPSGPGGSAKRIGPRLSLTSLLHYLWDQAGLTRWHPAFEGKRGWGTVRRHLLTAAEGKFTCGNALSARLYVPEPFSLATLADADARRAATWCKAKAHAGSHQQFLLLVAEAKRIEPARMGHRMVVRHLPDAAFAIDSSLFRTLTRRFTQALALWSASDSVRMVTAATFSVSTAGLPEISELCLMPVTREWLPVASLPEQRLVSQLVAERRSFIKVLRYGPRDCAGLASLTLTDCGSAPRHMYLED